MYLDMNLIIHDYHNGLDDLEEQLIRFVGDATARIEEDYLRILRYFRFRARMGRPDVIGDEAYVINTKTMGVIQALAPNLKSISGERIWAEISKILMMDKDRCVRSFKSMKSVGVLDTIGLADVDPEIMENVPDTRPAVILASSVKSKVKKAEVLVTLKNRYKVSRDEFAPVEFALKNESTPTSRINAMRLLATNEKDMVLAWASIMAPRDGGTSKKFGTWGTGALDNSVYSDARDVVVPEFPITGQDLIDLGFTPGPVMGKILRQLREMWADVEFAASREYLINLAYQTNGIIK
jgi:tRNA nucleotidyltransferase/poly(A) polymerase